MYLVEDDARLAIVDAIPPCFGFVSVDTGGTVVACGGYVTSRIICSTVTTRMPNIR